MAEKPIKIVESKNVYTLLIDEDRDNALAVVHSVLYNNDLIPELMEFLKDEGMAETYIAMQKEISDKQHRLGWCKAPDCGHPDADKQNKHE